MAKNSLTPEQRAVIHARLDALDEELAAPVSLVPRVRVRLDALELEIGYTGLPPAVQAVVSRAEVGSFRFQRAAAKRGFTPLQWAWVEGVVRQHRPQRRVRLTDFTPDGPHGLRVVGDLSFGHCPSLVALPPHLAVEGCLGLTGCPALAELPAHLVVGRWLFLASCDALTSLPTDITLRGCISVGGCPSLTSLPRGLMVAADFSLFRGTGLTALPDRLTIGRDLTLCDIQTPLLLPQDLRVGGTVYLHRCASDLVAQAQALQVRGRVGSVVVR